MIPRAILKPWISAQVSLSNAAKVGSARSRRRKANVARSCGLERLESRQMLTTIDLAALTVTEGMTIYGATGGELSGFSVSDAGDVNGDGLDDLIVSSKDQSRSGFSVAGASYLVFGSTTMPASIDLATIGTAGVTFQGVKGTGRFGYSVSAAGDVNADGFDDLIMSAPFGVGPMNEALAGDTYVFFGSASLPSIITANSANVTVYGAEAQDRSGISVSGAGDVNGDGYDDMVIGANLADAAGNAKSGAGESYVIYGGASMPATIDLATLGTGGITIYGRGASDQLGLSVSGAGDVNGDGFADVILGAGYADSTNGESYVIFGGSALPATIDLAVPASTFITILGEQGGDFAGYTASSGGDVNGDGFDDLLINAPGGDGPIWGTRLNAGDSYVVFGSASLPPTIDLLTLGTAGITIFGADSGDAGIDVNTGGFISNAGDVNADGYDDLIFGKERADAAGNAKSLAGESNVIFGGPSLPSTIDLLRPFGPSTQSSIVVNVSGEDNPFLAGAPNGTTALTDSAPAQSPTLALTGFDITKPFTFSAIGGFSFSGGTPTVSADGSPGNVAMNAGTLGISGPSGIRWNGLVGVFLDDSVPGGTAPAPLNSGTAFTTLSPGLRQIFWIGDGLTGTGTGDVQQFFAPPGATRLFLGASDGFGWALNTGVSQVTINPSPVPGIKIFGAGAADNNGVSVSSAGDVNGDGFADLLTGAFLADGLNNLRSSSGESYLIYGNNTFTSSVTHLGTSAAETLTGTAGANVMVGGRGNDILLGNGGADVLNGGEGDDTIAVSTLPFQRASGGNGDDTLRLDGSGLTLDLTTLADNRLQGIELIDITGSGINTLTLSYRDVLNISDESNRLIVRRNGGDVVNIGSGWTQGADQLIGSDNFQTYTQGIATLLIEDTTPVGTIGDDAFVFTYLSTSTSGNVSITRSTNAGPIEDLGVFPMNVPLSLDGLSGTDSIRLIGTSSADTFSVTASGLTINGASLTLSGFESQSLEGTAGNDLYQFDADTPLGVYSLVESGAGADTIDFSTTTLAVALNLGVATTQVVNANLSLNLGAVNTFENATGGSGNDVLTGNALANVLVGGSGNDTLNGARGNDSLLGGMGDDDYVFTVAATPEADSVTELPGEGIDRLSFTSLTTAVNVSLASTAIQNVHTNRTLQLNSDGTFENATGGSGSDIFTGNALNNILIGGSGNDLLTGGSGNDTLLGGLGDDVYVFAPATSAEADLVTEYSSQGVDLLDFGTVTTLVNLNLGAITVQAVHTNRTLQLNSAITFENIAGGTGNDILTGNTLNNVLLGGSGNDTLNGSRGNDSLFGGLGDDNYVFAAAATAEADSVTELPGEGTDRLNFTSITTAVVLELSSTSVQSIHTNRTLQLNAGNTLENATGGSGNDVLTGNALNNTLTGGSGNDTLNGMAGNDTMFGGLGDDVYVFSTATSAEADLVTEYSSQGTDLLDFGPLTTSVNLNLGLTTVQAIHTNRTLKLNSAITFENAAGGSGDDILLGNTLNNVLTGSDGNDVLVGSSGDDQLFGGNGRDILTGGLGLETLDGGADDDILIGGRTSSDASITRLTDLRTEWTSANSYATRIVNLRAGVGASNASLKATINVLNDAGEDDILTGGADTDWFFAALDDVITDLFAGEVLDVL